MRSRWTCCVAITLLIATQATAQEAIVKSRIVSVGLFKNGLAVVKREVLIPGAGEFRLDASPEAIHGTFWIESATKVESAVRMRDVDVPLHADGGVNLHNDLAGTKVTIHFRNDKHAPVTGTLMKAVRAERPEALMRSEPHEAFWRLKTAKGQLFVSPTDVLMVESNEVGDKIVQKKPVLLLTVEKSAKKPVVFVSYLTNGLAWAPSYHVDISDPKSLAIEMAAVIRNEMADLKDAELKLISGFPSVEFATVTSPLSAHTSWAKFFNEINNRGSHGDALLIQRQELSNNISINPVGDIGRFRPNLGATPAGEGVDLHFESIGKRTLLRDEAMSLTVGKAKADYERIIEWTVAPSPVSHKYGSRRSEGSPTKDEMWDVLVFKNPFKFPMTTAPAMVVENGRFNGQRTASWTNVGEEANLKITRSLSIRTVSREQEDNKANERVVVDDKNYTKVYLKGELVMSNHRKQPVKLHIRHAIRGTIHEIDGAPKLITREESLEDVNRTQEALWTVALAPGEERRLSYKYSVLVYRG